MATQQEPLLQIWRQGEAAEKQSIHGYTEAKRIGKAIMNHDASAIVVLFNTATGETFQSFRRGHSIGFRRV